MSLIIGIEYCKLDSNGRFKLPIAIKKQLKGDDNRFVVKTSVYADCLELWTYESFEAEIERLQKELNPYSIEDRELMRIVSAGNLVEMDTSDRLIIPTEQRARLKSSKDLVIQSYGKFMEIWDHDTYSRINEEVTGYAVKVDERLGRSTNAAEV